MLAALAGMVVAINAWITAQSSPAGFDWVQLVNGFGFPVVVIALFLADKLGTHAERDRLRRELAEAREELRQGHAITRNDLLPAVIESNRTNGELLRLLPQLVDRPGRRGAS